MFDKYEIDYNKEDIKELSFTKYGFWDLIFQNAFYINDEFYFYDQEWKEDGIPIEYILYRSIEYTKGLKEKLNIEKVWNDIGITQNHIELFKELDSKLQEKTRDEDMWQWHLESTKTAETLKEKVETLEEDKQKIIKDCQKLLNEKDARIKFLEDNMESTVEIVRQRESELARIKSSVLWKLSKPIRVIKKRGEKNEN